MVSHSKPMRILRILQNSGVAVVITVICDFAVLSAPNCLLFKTFYCSWKRFSTCSQKEESISILLVNMT